MCLKCSWNPILFGFCFLKWLSLENWDSLAQTDTQQIDTWQINFAGSIMTMELYSAQDSGPSTQGETTIWIIFQARTLSLLTTSLYQDIIFLCQGTHVNVFMVSITSQIDIALENENFPGLLEDLWTLHFHQGQLRLLQHSLWADVL